MTTEPTMISTSSIFPPHSVQDSEKFETLKAALETTGWEGRPLLVVEYGDVFQALTGSHRWAAADAAGIEEVPCVVVDMDALTEAGYDADDLRNATDDDAVYVILSETDDEDATEAILAEIQAN